MSIVKSRNGEGRTSPFDLLQSLYHNQTSLSIPFKKILQFGTIIDNPSQIRYNNNEAL